MFKLLYTITLDLIYTAANARNYAKPPEPRFNLSTRIFNQKKKTKLSVNIIIVITFFTQSFANIHLYIYTYENQPKISFDKLTLFDEQKPKNSLYFIQIRFIEMTAFHFLAF